MALYAVESKRSSARGASTQRTQSKQAKGGGAIPRVRPWGRAARVPLVASFVVLGLVALTYWPALSAEAQYMDDKFYIGTPLTQHPSWASVKAIFGQVLTPAAVNGYYQPLSLLSIMLDFLDPQAANTLLPFHRTSLLIHLANVELTIVLLRALFGNWLIAAALGLLFGVHPLNADALLWVAERKTLLSTFFVLGSLLSYLAYVRGQSRVRFWAFGLSVLAYALALLSKPTALPLVALILVLDFWPLRRLGRRALLEKIPFAIVGSLLAVVTVISQARAGGTGTTQFMNVLYLPMVIGYCSSLYLSKWVWPTGLVSDYPWPVPFRLSNLEVLGGVLAATMLGVVIVLSARRTRAWLAGAVFFVVALSPTLGIIRYTSSIAANRSMYLPMLGLFLPLAFALERSSKKGLGPLMADRTKEALVATGAFLLVPSIGVTRNYELKWRDTLTLLQYYLTQLPNDWKLRTRLGNEWIQRGNVRSAIVEFREAARLNPNWTENQVNLGKALFTAGEYAEAAQAFTDAAARAPSDWRTYMLLGLTRSRQGDLVGALREYRAAAKVAPNQAIVHFSLAEILVRVGRTDEAIGEYRETLRLDPGRAQARRALAALTTGAQ